MFELKPAFDVLFTRPDDLQLVTGEMWGECSRPVHVQPAAVTAADGTTETAVAVTADVEGEATMTSFEHLAEYVRSITAAKIEALKQQGGQLPTREVRMVDAGDDEVDREELVVVPEAEVEGGFEGDEE